MIDLTLFRVFQNLLLRPGKLQLEKLIQTTVSSKNLFQLSESLKHLSEETLTFSIAFLHRNLVVFGKFQKNFKRRFV